MRHNLKLSKLFATQVFNGVKSFEYRKNDRQYSVGDYLHFTDLNGEEFLPGEVLDDYDSGNLFKVTYLLDKSIFMGLPNNYVIMAIVRVDK